MVPGWAQRIAEAQRQPVEEIAGEAYTRKRYGEDGFSNGMTRCRDCGVWRGQWHVVGCCIERCARCGDQRLTCYCNDLEEELQQAGQERVQ